MKKRFFALLLLVVVVALTLAGCNSAEEKAAGTDVKKEEFYSMVVFTKGAEYFNWCYAGMKDAAKTIGDHIKVELQGPAEWDASLEARALEQVIAKKPNGILVAAADEATLIPAINKAIDAGIPVICFDSDAPESKRIAYVGTNNYDFGAVGAKAMVEMIGGAGEVAICLVPGTVAQEERAQGFKDYLAQHAPKVKVVTELNDEGDVAKTETLCTALLQSNPNIKGIFSTHGYGAPGAAAAVRTLKMQDKVVVIGSDYGTAVIELILNGEVQGTVIDDPYLIGYQAMMLAYAAAHPTDVPSTNPPFGHVPPLIYGGCSLLTKDLLQDPAVLSKYQNPPKID